MIIFLQKPFQSLALLAFGVNLALAQNVQNSDVTAVPANRVVSGVITSPPANAQAQPTPLILQNAEEIVPPDQRPVLIVSRPVDDVWGRIRSGFGMNDLQTPLVDSQQNFYATKPDYIARMTERASRYLYFVVGELERRRMPTELALLPFVESAFNPQAYSSAKAAGMWQFIPSTGRVFNLKQNMFRDERRDVIASTNAALDYLSKLYGMFGDWHLALAAYNWGEGSVGRAIAKNQKLGLPTDYLSLADLMPNETRNYVPKLIAMKNIVATPELFGLRLPKIENQPYFVTITKTRDIDVALAAKFAELSLADFRSLNPSFSKPIITGANNPQLLLPPENAQAFQRNLAAWDKPLSSWTAFTVPARTRIQDIAQKFGTTVPAILSANNIPPKMRLKAGSSILVPKARVRNETPETEKQISASLADNAMLSIEPDVPDTKRISIRTGRKDTLAGIAKRYGVTITQIRKWNHFNSDKLKAGTRLTLVVPYKSKLKSKVGGKTRASTKRAKNSKAGRAEKSRGTAKTRARVEKRHGKPASKGTATRGKKTRHK